MPKKVQLQNGWRFIKDDPPPEGRHVLVTNNPEARNAHGDMSHIWLTCPIKDGRSWMGFDDAHRRIERIVAWHPLPGNATD